jgi:hypothetical protein
MSGAAGNGFRTTIKCLRGAPSIGLVLVWEVMGVSSGLYVSLKRQEPSQLF